MDTASISLENELPGTAGAEGRAMILPDMLGGKSGDVPAYTATFIARKHGAALS